MLGVKNSLTKVYIPARYVLVGIIFLGLFVTAFITTNLSLAIVAMVKKPEDNCTLDIDDQDRCSNGTHLKLEGTCPGREFGNETTEFENDGTYSWSTTTQGAILGSFFYGIAATQLAVGHYADKLNNRIFVGISTFLGSIFTILVPVASDVGYALLIILRAMTGTTQCVLYVCVSTLLIRWIPQVERNLMFCVSVSGFGLGQLVGPLVVGWLCKQSFAGGWPFVFYIVGLAGILWSVLWLINVSNQPSDHPRISDEEKSYILQGTSDQNEKSKVAFKTPWKLILTSGPVWWYIITFACSSWIFFSRLTLLPKYMSQVLHFPIEENGEVNSLINGSYVLSTIASGFIADKILAKNWLSKTNTRKLMETFGLGGSSLCLLGVTFSGCNSTLVIIFLAFSSLLHGFTVSGDGVIQMDLAPTLTGTLIGISNSIATATGFISPLITGLILDSSLGDLTINEKWNIVFYISSFIGIIGTSVALFLWSAEAEPWDPINCAGSKLEKGNVNQAYVEESEHSIDEKTKNTNEIQNSKNNKDVKQSTIETETENSNFETQNEFDNNFEFFKSTKLATLNR